MRKTLIFMLAVVIVLMAVGCGKSGETLDKITLNEVTHSVFYAPQYAAIYLGYFEENGIEVEALVDDVTRGRLSDYLPKEPEPWEV